MDRHPLCGLIPSRHVSTNSALKTSSSNTKRWRIRMAIERGGSNQPRERLSSSHSADHDASETWIRREKKRWMDFDLSLENELHLVNEQLLPPPLNFTLPLFGHENPKISFPTFVTDRSRNWRSASSIDGNYSLRMLSVNF